MNGKKQEFEKYAKKYDYDLTVDENGEYIMMETADAYDRFMYDETVEDIE